MRKILSRRLQSSAGKKSSRLKPAVHIIVLSAIALAGLALAQVPIDVPTDGAGHYIVWDAFTSSGNEDMLALIDGDSIVGWLSHTVDGSAPEPMYGIDTDTFAVIRHGERMIHFDVRPPHSWIDSLDTISFSPIWLVSWGAMDTTHRDGEGWGLKGYWVQYTIDSVTGIWYDWFINSDQTDAYFGPTSPVEVEDGHRYYFRVRSEDLNTNVEGFRTFDRYVLYQEPSLRFSVKNLRDDVDWTVTDTYTIGEDNIVSPTSDDVFIIKNLSIIDSINIAVKAFPYAIPEYFNWELADYPDTVKFALRAIFNDDGSPPTEAQFSDPDNIIRDTFIVADENMFGPRGFGIAPVWTDSLSRTDNLWLELMIPTWSYVFGDTTDIQMILQLRAIPVTH